MNDKDPFIEQCPYDREDPYVSIPQNLIRDENLSMSCRWMLIYLLSNTGNWKVNVSQIWNHCKRHHGGGRDNVRKWINEAIEAGYMKKEEYVNEKNLTRIRYYVSRSPKFKKFLRRPEFQGPESQGPVDHTLKKDHKEEIKKEIKKEKDSPSAQTTTRQASRTTTSSKIFLNEKGKFEGITPEDIDEWQKTFSSLSVRKELDRCVLWAKNNHRKNYRKSILTWFMNVEKSHTEPFKASTVEEKEVSSTDIAINKKKALEWELKAQEKGLSGPYAVQAMPTKISFILPYNQGFSVEYHKPKEEFEKLCQKALEKMRINTM